MQNDLLWVYEGLTQYYGWVLAARSGFWTPDQFLGYVTFKLYNENGSPGRLWRSVQDTADGSAFLRGGAAQYSNWRRGQDYYDEGALIWMEADAKIRELTGGKKTLDDFAKGFFGGTTTWRVVPYTFADVVKALNAVAPYDWKGFWLTRLNSHAVDVPLGGPEAAGYRYVEKDEMSPLEKATVSPELFGDFWDSLGFTSFAKGEVYDVVWNSLAFRAGLAPDDTIAKVNGKDYTVAGLIEAVKAAKTGKDPIMLTVKREDAEMVVKLDYHGGEKYSWLVRDDGKADMFAELVRARASAAPPK